jgi:hypothetical protein
MGDIETNTNTKTALSKMSRWKPTLARLRGLCESNDARVSRSSRGKKSVVGGDAVEGQKLVGTVVRLRAPCNPSRI